MTTPICGTSTDTGVHNGDSNEIKKYIRDRLKELKEIYSTNDMPKATIMDNLFTSIGSNNNHTLLRMLYKIYNKDDLSYDEEKLLTELIIAIPYDQSHDFDDSRCKNSSGSLLSPCYKPDSHTGINEKLDAAKIGNIDVREITSSSDVAIFKNLGYYSEDTALHGMAKYVFNMIYLNLKQYRTISNILDAAGCAYDKNDSVLNIIEKDYEIVIYNIGLIFYQGFFKHICKSKSFIYVDIGSDKLDFIKNKKYILYYHKLNSTSIYISLTSGQTGDFSVNKICRTLTDNNNRIPLLSHLITHVQNNDVIKSIYMLMKGYGDFGQMFYMIFIYYLDIPSNPSNPFKGNCCLTTIDKFLANIAIKVKCPFILGTPNYALCLLNTDDKFKGKQFGDAYNEFIGGELKIRKSEDVITKQSPQEFYLFNIGDRSSTGFQLKVIVEQIIINIGDTVPNIWATKGLKAQLQTNRKITSEFIWYAVENIIAKSNYYYLKEVTQQYYILYKHDDASNFRYTLNKLKIANDTSKTYGNTDISDVIINDNYFNSAYETLFPNTADKKFDEMKINIRSNHQYGNYLNLMVFIEFCKANFEHVQIPSTQLNNTLIYNIRKYLLKDKYENLYNICNTLGKRAGSFTETKIWAFEPFVLIKNERLMQSKKYITKIYKTVKEAYELVSEYSKQIVTGIDTYQKTLSFIDQNIKTDFNNQIDILSNLFKEDILYLCKYINIIDYVTLSDVILFNNDYSMEQYTTLSTSKSVDYVKKCDEDIEKILNFIDTNLINVQPIDAKYLLDDIREVLKALIRLKIDIYGTILKYEQTIATFDNTFRQNGGARFTPILRNVKHNKTRDGLLKRQKDINIKTRENTKKKMKEIRLGKTYPFKPKNLRGSKILENNFDKKRLDNNFFIEDSIFYEYIYKESLKDEIMAQLLTKHDPTAVNLDNVRLSISNGNIEINETRGYNMDKNGNIVQTEPNATETDVMDDEVVKILHIDLYNKITCFADYILYSSYKHNEHDITKICKKFLKKYKSSPKFKTKVTNTCNDKDRMDVDDVSGGKGKYIHIYKRSAIKKEILGKNRCIYVKSGSKNEYIKHQGSYVTIKDYIKLYTKPAKEAAKPAKEAAKAAKALLVETSVKPTKKSTSKSANTISQFVFQ